MLLLNSGHSTTSMTAITFTTVRALTNTSGARRITAITADAAETGVSAFRITTTLLRLQAAATRTSTGTNLATVSV